jgi:thiamine kinase-like enzyme
MKKPNYICNHIDRQTKIYYITKPDPQLVNLTCQLFQPFASNFTEKQFNEKFQTIHRYHITEVYCFEYQKEVYYAKKFILRSLENTVSQVCKGPKGLRCMTLADKLISLGFKVPESVCVISHQNSLLAKENIYLTKKYDSLTLGEFISKNINQSKNEVVTALLSFTATLGTFYKNRFGHFDTNLYNFLINEAYEIVFIDLDAINNSLMLKLPLNLIVKELAQLNGNFFTFFVQNNMSHLYTPDRVVFYLKNFLKFNRPQADVLKVFAQLKRKTLLHLAGLGNNSITTLFYDKLNINP